MTVFAKRNLVKVSHFFCFKTLVDLLYYSNVGTACNLRTRTES
uniref:Uncharacterized protein n=1 Tax=Anguilla anguilla TaxID=7936 RepID=A0A0E9QIH9_ANGAN